MASGEFTKKSIEAFEEYKKALADYKKVEAGIDELFGVPGPFDKTTVSRLDRTTATKMKMRRRAWEHCRKAELRLLHFGFFCRYEQWYYIPEYVKWLPTDIDKWELCRMAIPIELPPI